jgi:predicted nucleic acid-binding protein
LKRRVLLDTGPLVALLDRRDRFHRWARLHFADIEPPLLTCEAVLAEACHLLRNQEGGATAVLDLLGRGALRVAFALEEQAAPVQALLTRYADVPISLADACLVRMAELDAGSPLLTVDSDFSIYRIHGRRIVPTIRPAEL